uniref:Ig-like domain-containing protein n=1 Tax=Oryzias latipes TaxID=8090 RepID=A0A3P9HHB7_ORYLA
MCSFQFQVTEIPPKCIVPLMNVTAAVGTPVILQCLVKGKPTPTAAWHRDGDPITDSRCIIQEKAAGHFNLLITNVTHSDAGEYKCVIKNSAGCTETTEYTLVITRVTSEYEGEYSCTSDVSQAERWVEKMFQTRGQPPSFTAQIQPVTCSEGGEVSFQYRAQGDPVPDVKCRNCIILTHPDGSGLISIKSVKQGDSGLYTCKATNQFGEATCSAELVVFREQEQVTVVQKKGYKVSVSEQFECETEDAPNVTFKWYKSSVEIRHSEKYRILSRPTSSSLEVVKPVKADSGEYTCKASNQHGTDSCTATVSQPWSSGEHLIQLIIKFSRTLIMPAIKGRCV